MTNPIKRPQWIFFVIGFLLLIVAFLISTSEQQSGVIRFLGSASQDLAFIILTIVVVDFLWAILGGEPINQVLTILTDTLREMRASVKLLEESKTTGLEQVYSVSGALGSHSYWMSRLASAKEKIELMGYSLHVWTRGDNFENVVIRLAQGGVKIRVLIMDENNKDLESLINSRQITSVSTAAAREEVRVAQKVFVAISNHLKGTQSPENFEFRTLKKGLIVCQLCRTDSELTMVQYLYSVVASRSPLMLIRGQDTQLFDVYSKEFERLWEIAETPEGPQI
jgi:hypothetical protein